MTIGACALIALSASFAWVLARLAGLPWVTVLLGTSPGGIAEMCITAKVLQLGVPVVTAFHVTRYIAVLLCMAPLFRWLELSARLTRGVSNRRCGPQSGVASAGNASREVVPIRREIRIATPGC